jgi:hypothetical protein
MVTPCGDRGPMSHEGDIRGEIVVAEPLARGSVVAGDRRGVYVNQSCAIHKQVARVPRVVGAEVHAGRPHDGNPYAALFLGLPNGGLGGVLAVLNETGGKHPVTEVRRVTTLDEQYLPFSLDEDGGA